MSDILLTKILCRSCNKERWNDGLKCPHCGEYENKHLKQDGGIVIDTRFKDRYHG